MAPRHVAIVIASLGAGGAERVATRLANAWVDRGDRVTVITLASPAEPPAYPLDPRVHRVGLDVMSASTSAVEAVVATARRVRAIRTALRATTPDRVLAMLDATNVLTLLATRGMGLPVVVAERSDPSRCPLRAEWQWLRRRTYAWARAVVVQTERAGAFFDGWRGVQTRVIPNPVVAPPVADVPRDTTIVAAGRLGPEKGFDLLIEAFARIAASCATWRLVIHGAGPLEHDLRAQAARLGLAARVTLAGHASDLANRLREAGIFVLSSRYEGFPNVLCEAMAVGTPVVAFDIASGPREILRDGLDGILVAPGSAEALAEGMRLLIVDADRRREIGERGRSVLERYALPAVLGAWDDVLH
jgi:GalNAc-alpha-(1->4)-GalNAc-alpha-(1->3)-diNAcBac-PP-undecaprenol alpha-1,4-N-acetyl-D-galactosaminyltransferase